MKIVDDVLYFDDMTNSSGRVLKYSFYLDLKNKKVVFSNECSNFLNNLKEYVLNKGGERLVTLSVYNVKSDFERIICLDMLDLGYNGCMMDTACYQIPESLTIESIDDIFNYDKVLSFLKDSPVGVLLKKV